MNEKFNENLRKARIEIYNTFSIPEKRYFWRSIVEYVTFGHDREIHAVLSGGK